MALTGSERVKRWREKNRALYNLRRRSYRKKDLSGNQGKPDAARCNPISSVCGSMPEVGSGTDYPTRNGEQASRNGQEPGHNVTGPVAQLSPEVTVGPGKFPKMISLSSPSKVIEEAPPTVYRDDYGRVITKGQWEKLQGIKDRAKEGGYIIDEYSQ